MDSIWPAGIELPHFQSMEGSRTTDVLIIGGAGLHDAGPDSVHRPVFREPAGLLYRDRVQQMGHDFLSLSRFQI